MLRKAYHSNYTTQQTNMLTALAVRQNSAIEQYMKEAFKGARNTKAKHRGSQAGALAGRLAGQQVSLGGQQIPAQNSRMLLGREC